MAGVFLSYAHRDNARAKVIAGALAKAGHSVWWDLHVRGGAEFANVIDEALQAADVVVVLWSSNSVKSAWVRDEAAAGRDNGRLIPIQIDGAETPLGFRQFQNLDFTRWKGRTRSIEFQQLINAIDSIGGTHRITTVQPHYSGPAFAASRRTLEFALILAGALAMIIFLAMRLYDTEARPPTVKVAAAEPSPQSQGLARELLVKLGRLQAAKPDALEIIISGQDKSADFIFQVSASQVAGKATASLAIVGRNQALLWSKEFERSLDQYGDLKQQLALTAARVLDCATRAITKKGSRLDRQTLKLFLTGCARRSEIAGHDFRDLVSVFREVTKRAPDFEDGWANLVASEAAMMGWESISSDSPEGVALKKDMASARKLNPRMPEAYFGDAILASEKDVKTVASILDRAARDNPDDPIILGMRVDFLRRVGRLKDAVQAGKRGADLDPLDPGAMVTYIQALAYAGQHEAALQEIDKAEKLWPGTRIVTDEAIFRFHLRYGDPNIALRIIRTINPDDAFFESFLRARINPTKANIDRAIADARAEVSRSPRGIGYLVLALAQFGREELIYPIVENPRGLARMYLGDAFFRPEFRRFRQDARFMKVEQDLGLVDYWQKSGNWPDFCFEPQLPYDCKEEAAKLAA